MAMLTKAAIQGYKEYTKRTVAFAQYKIGSTYYKTGIESVKLLDDGLVEVTFKIELKSGSGTVTEVQLYDTGGNLWLSKTESLKLADVSEGFYYAVQIDIEEVSK